MKLKAIVLCWRPILGLDFTIGLRQHRPSPIAITWTGTATNYINEDQRRSKLADFRCRENQCNHKRPQASQLELLFRSRNFMISLFWVDCHKKILFLHYTVLQFEWRKINKMKPEYLCSVSFPKTPNLAYKFVFGLDVGLTRLVTVRMVTNSSAAEGWIPT